MLPSSSSTCPTTASFPPPSLPAAGRSSSKPTNRPTCGVIASRRKERCLQGLRDVPVAGSVDVLWSKYGWYCEEPACDRLSFFESAPQVPRRARSRSRLPDQLVDAVISLRQGCPGDSCRLRRGQAEPADAGHRLTPVPVRALLPGPRNEGVDTIRAVDDADRGSGHRSGPGGGRRPRPPGRRRLVVRLTTGMAPGGAGRRDRPLGDIP